MIYIHTTLLACRAFVDYLVFQIVMIAYAGHIEEGRSQNIIMKKLFRRRIFQH